MTVEFTVRLRNS